MGQTLRSFSDSFNHVHNQKHHHHHNEDNCNMDDSKLPDLAAWPPELSLNVLKNLNATDLCLAACVWTELARDSLLWHSLCHTEWPYTSIYFRPKSADFSYHKLYLTLDEATITFNADCHLGMDYFLKNQLIDDNPDEIAKFLFRAKPLDRTQVRQYLQSNQTILERLVALFDFQHQTLPDALRHYFSILEVPNKYDHYLHVIVDRFSHRYVQCNPQPATDGLMAETIYVLCFSLIMLSADLFNPQIKNKMSKREFIRNVRRALRVQNDDYYGDLYDDIYLRGHIAGSSNAINPNHHHPINHTNKNNNHFQRNKRFHMIR